MSWSLLDIPLRGAQFMATQPKLAAETAKTWAEVPLTEQQAAVEQARVPLNAAQAAYYNAQAPYYGALTNKTAIEAAQSQIILNNMQSRGRNTGTSYTLPSDDEGTTPATQGGGGGDGGNIGPGTPGGPSDTTRELMAYAPPQPAPPGAGPAPGSTMLAAAAPQPQLGFGGVTAASPLMMGAATTQPVSPGVASALADPNALVADPDTKQMVPKSQYLASHPQVQTQPPPPAPAPTQLAQAGPPGAVPAPTGSAAMRRTPVAGQRPQPGEYFAPLGVTVPPELVDSYWMALRNGANPVDALEHIRQVRQNTLLQLAYGGGTPQTWRKSVETAYLTGFLDEDHYRTLHTHPELWMDTIRQLQDPKVTAEQDQRMRDQGMSYSHAAHNYAWDTTLHAGAAPEQAGYQKNSDGTYTPLFLTPNERAARAGVPIMGGAPGPLEGGGGGGRPPVPGAPAPGASAAPGAPAPGAPQGTRPFDVYTAAVRTHEGTSPTMGNYGWIPSTKVAMARQYAPEAVKGMSDEQIVAAQLSPDAEEKMMQGFTANNAVKLGEAGIRASGANLGMAHYIGAQGVKNLATVPPDMTMTQMEQNGLLAKGSVAGNRELQGNTTARGFIQWAQRKYGNTTLSADDISGATKVAGPGTPPAATPTATSAAAPAPMYQGKPEVPIGGDTQIAQDQKRIDEDYAAQHEAQLAARQANAPMSMITDLSHRIQNIAPGAGGEFRAEVEEAMREWSPGIVQRWTKWATGHDFNDSSDRFAAMKEFTTLAIAQEAQMPGVRSGLGLTQLNQHASPNINMPEKAIHDLLNAMLVRNQSIKDFAAGFQPLIEPRYQAWRSPTGAMPSPYKPVQPEWEQEWNKASGIHSPRVYQAATDVLNGHDHEDLAKWYGKMSPEQQAEVKRIVRDVDPQYVSPANQHAPAPAQ